MVLVLIFVLVQIFWPNIWYSLFSSIVKPFWRLETSLLNDSAYSFEKLLNENRDLKNQLSLNELNIRSIRLLEQENADLKKILNRASSTPRILSAVLKRPPINTYDELIIDIGVDYGLATGTLVYSVENVPIGQIVDVFEDTSRVVLFSSPGFKYEVMIGKNHESTTAFGRGGGQFEANISKTASVNEGDIVVASEFHNRPLGFVTAKISEAADPFSRVLFSLPINISNIQWVTVEQNQKR
jgi:cell shape-determining protein MreC